MRFCFFWFGSVCERGNRLPGTWTIFAGGLARSSSAAKAGPWTTSRCCAILAKPGATFVRIVASVHRDGSLDEFRPPISASWSGGSWSHCAFGDCPNWRSPLRSRADHLFRHGLATKMVRHGASLSEIAGVLRHRSQSTLQSRPSGLGGVAHRCPASGRFAEVGERHPARPPPAPRPWAAPLWSGPQVIALWLGHESSETTQVYCTLTCRNQGACARTSTSSGSRRPVPAA